MRESVVTKTPYTLILGDKEKESNTISYRYRVGNETINITLDKFIDKLNDEIDKKVMQ